MGGRLEGRARLTLEKKLGPGDHSTPAPSLAAGGEFLFGETPGLQPLGLLGGV